MFPLAILLLVLRLQDVYADHIFHHHRALEPQFPVSVFQVPDTVSSSAPLLILPHQESLPVNTSPTQTADASSLLVMGYYPDWAGPSFPPEKIDFKRFDWIDFAFALPDENLNLIWDDPENSPSLLYRLVGAAHDQGSKVKLSIGGWTGSKYFSPAVSTPESRRVFAGNILAAYNTFGLDGIDLDWEYPGHQGADGNLVDSNDTANFLLFLQYLRSVLPPSARISAAALTLPFLDAQERPLQDLSDFAKSLDWVLIMNYDVWGSSSPPGPNSPLHDGCENSTQPDASAVSAYNAWTSAGFPASKLVLGLPSYGYVSPSSATRLRTRSTSHWDKRRQPGGTVKVVDEDGGSDSQVRFRDLVGQGALVRYEDESSSPSFKAAGGFERNWDDCSCTPFLRSLSSGQVVAYDDPMSLGMKAVFVRKVGMLGINMFDMQGDTDQWDLTDSIRKSMGLTT